jgi:hypothetical protein
MDRSGAMDQINQAKNEQSLAIVPVAAPACFAVSQSALLFPNQGFL